MKTIMKSIVVGTLLLGVASSTDVMAQGRGNGYGKNNNPGHNKNWKSNSKGHDNDRREYAYHNDHDRWGYDDHRHYRHHDDRVVHHHYYRHVRWEPVQHYHVRPRYVYYRDYNVYYDTQRDVFVTFSNGRWMIGAQIPLVMARVNFATAVAVGVDYYEDDIGYYVARRRPAYFSIRAAW